jgi:predicted NBD/HSP70 family sugar kinase
VRRKVEKPARMLSGTNIEAAHFHNQRVILETVRIYGPLSRAEISGRTALSSQTISNIVDKLLDRGTLETRGRRIGRRGQPAIELDINPRGGYAVGLSLDRDYLTGVLLDLAGTAHQFIHHEWNFPSPATALPLMIETVRQLIQNQSLRTEDIWGVGVGAPGPLDLDTGSLVNPPNFPGWNGLPLRTQLSEALGLPVLLENVATAAAVGERWFGQGRGTHDFFYVFFALGLGGGMILDGRPYRGGFDNAAMFGHIPVEPNGLKCECGGTGCLEMYVSMASLYKTLRESGHSVEGAGPLSGLLASEDQVLMGWLEQAAERLARALVTVENLLNPTTIIFGGRLPVPLVDWLLLRLEARLPQLQMRALTNHPRLLRAQATDHAAALGAATLPLFEMFTPGQMANAKAELVLSSLD